MLGQKNLCADYQIDGTDPADRVRRENLLTPTLPGRLIDFGQNARTVVMRGGPSHKWVVTKRTNGQNGQRVIKSSHMLFISPGVFAQRPRAPLLIVRLAPLLLGLALGWLDGSHGI